MKKHRKKGKAPKAPHKRLQELPPMTVSRADLNIAADPDPPAEELNSAAADVMAIDDILEQLASMKDNALSFIVEKEGADPVWAADVAACEAATAILSALQDEGIKDPEQVRDLVHDYKALAEQYQTMRQHYIEPAKPERLGTLPFTVICPKCHRQVKPVNSSYCQNCGKRLGWR